MNTQNTHRFKLIIFNIEKNNNVGLLLRSAYAFGCQEVLIVGKSKIKLTGSAGTSLKVKRKHFFQLKEAVDYCKLQEFAIYGVEIGGTPLPGYQFDRDVAFILGNEGRGLADATAFCEQILTIPQWGGVPSLNVATAGAIAMYSFACQQANPIASSQDQRYYDQAFPLETKHNSHLES